MKQLLAWILCLGMLLCMVACGDKTPVADLKPSESHTEDPTTPETASPSTPDPTEPTPTEATDPTSSEPAATDPAPTEPTPTEPAPTEPDPTEPAPTDPTQAPHVHNYQLEKVDPTCEKDGFMRYICSCGDIYNSIKMDKTDHRWNSASCAAPKTCTKCGKTEGTALPHTWRDATYASAKTCIKCYATEGEPLAAPEIILSDSFPKVYCYYTRYFTVQSCETTFKMDKTETYCYININMQVTRDNDTTPTDGRLRFKVNIYDDAGILIKQDKISSGDLSHNETGIMTASISLPKNYLSSSYTLSFEYNY